MSARARQHGQCQQQHHWPHVPCLRSSSSNRVADVLSLPLLIGPLMGCLRPSSQKVVSLPLLIDPSTAHALVTPEGKFYISVHVAGAAEANAGTAGG